MFEKKKCICCDNLVSFGLVSTGDWVCPECMVKYAKNLVNKPENQKEFKVLGYDIKRDPIKYITMCEALYTYDDYILLNFINKFEELKDLSGMEAYNVVAKIVELQGHGTFDGIMEDIFKPEKPTIAKGLSVHESVELSSMLKG